MGDRGEHREDRLAGSEGGSRDREHFLAHARVALAVVCTVTASISPACLGQHVASGRALVLLYLIYGLLNLMIVRLHRRRGLAWELGLASAEVVITSLIITFTGGAQSYFLGLYLFVLLAAACKWGFNGAVLTSSACIAFVFSNLIIPPAWFGSAPNAMADSSSFTSALALSATLVSAASLVGLLVERDNKRYGDAVVITRLVRDAVPEPGFSATLGHTLRLLREYFDADMVRLAIQEIGGDQCFAWEVTRVTGQSGEAVRSWNLTKPARGSYFAMPPVEVRRGLRFDRAAVDGKTAPGAANRMRGTALGPSRPSTSLLYSGGTYDLDIVSEHHTPLWGSWSLLATSFSFEGKWLGRLTICNARGGRRASTDARFLADLVREVGPAVYGKYLVGRLRSRAQAQERVRLVQELHDGVIQSLIGLEMQIDVLRRTRAATCQPSCPQHAMGHLQELVHNEIANLREEMQRIKPLTVEPRRLFEHMAGTVDRFGRDQGISASLSVESQEVSLSPHVCIELVRILQEALVNVRKHSRAHKVIVRFFQDDGRYKLSVQDDGLGFGFTGRLSAAELLASSQCPLIIKERVDAIGGELMIESLEGSGAKLEVSVPLTANGRVFSDD